MPGGDRAPFRLSGWCANGGPFRPQRRPGRSTASQRGSTMTILGKILVIVNLVFSLFVGAFIVLFFAKQTNWREASEKWHRYADVAEADRQASEADAERIRKEESQKVADVQARSEERRGGKEWRWRW